METTVLLRLVTEVRKQMFLDRISITDAEIQRVLTEAKRLYAETR